MLRNMLEGDTRPILDYMYTSISRAYKIEFLDSQKVFNLYNINIMLYASIYQLLLVSYIS